MGLWRGADPGEHLQAARAAYERGDVESVTIHAALARQSLAEAETVGRQRAVYAAGAAGVLVLLIVGFVIRGAVKRPRSRSRVKHPAPLDASATFEASPLVAAELSSVTSDVIDEPTVAAESHDDGRTDAPR